MDFKQQYMQDIPEETEEEKQAYENWYNYHKECELFDLSIGILGQNMTTQQRRMSTINAMEVRLKYNINYWNRKQFQKIKYRAERDVEKELSKK